MADAKPPVNMVDGRIVGFGRLRDWLVGYIGTTGQLGPLGFLASGIQSTPDAEGYSHSRLGIWRRQFNGFTVFSLQPEVLAAVTPQLKFQQAPRPAQLWLRVADPSDAQMTPLLNSWGYGEPERPRWATSA